MDNKPQKPQKSRKPPQKSPLPSRKKTPQEAPRPSPTVTPQESPLKSNPSGESFGIVDNQAPQGPGDMSDLLKEAQGTAAPEGATDAQPGQGEQSGEPGAAVDAVPIKDSFTDVMANIWFSALRLGTQYAAKADLSPMTPDQRVRLNRVMMDVSQKYLPPLLLGMQEEMSLAGVSVEIVMTNIKKMEQPKDGQQDNSNTGAQGFGKDVSGPQNG